MHKKAQCVNAKLTWWSRPLSVGGQSVPSLPHFYDFQSRQSTSTHGVHWESTTYIDVGDAWETRIPHAYTVVTRFCTLQQTASELYVRPGRSSNVRTAFTISPYSTLARVRKRDVCFELYTSNEHACHAYKSLHGVRITTEKTETNVMKTPTYGMRTHWCLLRTW